MDEENPVKARYHYADEKIVCIGPLTLCSMREGISRPRTRITILNRNRGNNYEIRGALALSPYMLLDSDA